MNRRKVVVYRKLKYIRCNCGEKIRVDTKDILGVGIVANTIVVCPKCGKEHEI